MTYLLMSVPFAVVALAAFALGALRARARGHARAYVVSWAAAAGILVVLTALFDNVMIAADLFDFGQGSTTGVRFGLMPVEDFLYPVVGSLLLAGVWELIDVGVRAGEGAESGKTR